MGLDIRLPIAWLFLLLGAELAFYGQHPVNRACAGAFILFGALFRLWARRNSA